MAQLARLALFASVLVLLCSVVFVVNQTAQVVALANTVSPAVGQIVLYGLLIVYALVIFVPIAMFARLPKAIRPPADDQSPEFQTFLQQLGARLATNPHLAGLSVQPGDRAGIEAALRMLDAKADQIIKATASTVFVSTAISQNGRLDALMVLAAQSRMVWQLAHLYYQRPALRELIGLYANIGATVFLVSEIEDLDISEQVEPVIASALGGSLASAAPGMTVAATIVTQSILEGTANAFLTLRIGVICQRYCGSLAPFNRKAARRHATVAAASMLGAIVGSSAAVVTRAILRAAKKAGLETVESVTGGIRKLGTNLKPAKRTTRPDSEN